MYKLTRPFCFLAQVAEAQMTAWGEERYWLEVVISVYNIKMTEDEFETGIDQRIRLKDEQWAKDILTYDIGLVMAAKSEGPYDKENGHVLDLFTIYYDDRKAPFRLPDGSYINNRNEANKLFGAITTSTMFGATGDEVCKRCSCAFNSSIGS